MTATATANIPEQKERIGNLQIKLNDLSKKVEDLLKLDAGQIASYDGQYQKDREQDRRHNATPLYNSRSPLTHFGGRSRSRTKKTLQKKQNPKKVRSRKRS
jgi:hypothetical protein